jgi:protein-S-isoprenylcysteine O-methyltransferase Ste14
MTRQLARLRVPLGFACGIAVFWLARPTRISLMIGGVVAVIGEALRIWAAGHLHKSREVTTSGPYRYMAHPLYVGSAIMGIGLAIASGDGAVAGVIAVYLSSTIAAAIWSEEAHLRARFGDHYDHYRKGGAEERAGATRAFSMSQAIANREYRAVAGLAAAALLLLWKARL